MANRIRLECPSLPENVGLARIMVAALAAQAPFSLSDVEEVKVAVSEAVSNAVLHGYGGDPTGSVEVEASLVDEMLTITVTDRGVGMEDLALARQAASADPERMGLGFVFMETFMDSMEVETWPHRGTVVRMRRRAKGPVPVPPDAR